jgi:hypothetical protein
VERGKPVTLPTITMAWEGKPQGELIEWRAEEDGKSEGHSVMEWIGVAAVNGCSDHSTRKRADFHRVFHDERDWQTD